MKRLSSRRKGSWRGLVLLTYSFGYNSPDPVLSLSPILPRCEKVKTMEVTSVSIELEKNFSNFPRQYFALRKILKQLIGELFPKGY